MAATINLSSFPFSQQYNCPHCHNSITVYDPSGSEYVVCSSCSSYCRVVSGGSLQVQQHVPPIKYNPVLPIGAEGKLKDVPYKVVGYLEKKESGTEYEYEWREYMLYNFKKGYVFLAEYDGHWSLIAGKQFYPELSTASADNYNAAMGNLVYAKFNAYTPVITGLTGEYDWDVFEERVLTTEFINPPFILVSEKNKSNQKIIDWYLGEYIYPREIAEGFKIAIEKFPDLLDIGANQPNPHRERWRQSLRISTVAFVLVILIQVIVSVLKPTNLIMDKTVALSLPPPPKTDSIKKDTGINALAGINTAPTNGNYEYQSLKTSTFTIFNGPAPVKVELTSPVDNNWFEATLELVNEKDNQTWVLNKEIEYYHGYSDGESWSEGSNSETATLPNIPAGKYHINIYPYAGTNTIDQMSIKVTANIFLWQNIIITFLLLCIYPLYCWYRQRQFEVNRWMGNYNSPYKKIIVNE